MEAYRFLTPMKCLKALCLFRFLNPESEIRAAGGREVNLRSLQQLALYPANSIFIDGYLTTPGQQVEDARRMIEDMGFEVETGSTGGRRVKGGGSRAQGIPPSPTTLDPSPTVQGVM
jgi:biotin synthase-like enzyme